MAEDKDKVEDVAKEKKDAAVKDAAVEESVADEAAQESEQGGEKGAAKTEKTGEKKSAPAAAPVSRHTRYGVVSGVVNVTATFNNTKVTITDQKGNVIAWRTAGRCGFKGSRKSTAYAATIVAQEATREAASKGLREAQVRLNGPGAGRESAVRAVQAANVKVTAIQDVTPIPHNGCRPPKRRRV